jgi:hypothetical protein
MSFGWAIRLVLVTAFRVWCRVVVLDADGSALAYWTEGGRDAPDLAVVERLAWLRLAALRFGGGVVLTEVLPDLDALLELAGLSRQVCGQPEVGEEPLGLEEGIERHDLPT